MSDGPHASTALLSFASTLVWQGIVVAALLFFRQQLAGLLGRVASLKTGGTEISFQPEIREAAATPPETRSRITVGPDGFLESGTVWRVVQDSDQIKPGEAVKDLLLLFASPKQRTWVVATNHRLVFVLDDEGTQASGRFIQRVRDLSSITDIQTFPHDPNTGKILIGDPPRWYFSVSLHPDPDALEMRIARLAGRR